MSQFRLQQTNDSSRVGAWDAIAWDEQMIAFVYTRYHEKLIHRMLDAGVACLRSHNHACAERTMCIPAPGAFEIPWVTQQLLTHNTAVTGVVTLGAVVRGGTPHFEYVSHAVSSGVLQVSLAHKVPVTFGVLTVDNMEQAYERVADGNNKGEEATLALLELLAVKTELVQS